MSVFKVSDGENLVDRTIGKLEVFKHLDKDNPIEIYYQEDATINIGNYESTKIHLGLKVSCVLSQLEQTKEDIIKYVNVTIENKVKTILEEIGR